MVVWSMPGRLQLGRVVLAESFGERHHERDAHRREMGGADIHAGADDALAAEVRAEVRRLLRGPRRSLLTRAAR